MADTRKDPDGESGKDSDLDGPGVTAGVPDRLPEGESKGTPDSDREKTERAGHRNA